MNKIGAIVLAGGRSRRFGSDKRLAELDGRSLLSRATKTARAQTDRVVFSAGSAECEPTAPAIADDSVDTIPVVFDRQPGMGPMAGILAGLSWFRENDEEITRAAVFCADTPFLPPDYVARLNNAAPNHIALSQYKNRLHFTCAGFPVTAISVLSGFLDRGERRAETFIREYGFEIIDFSACEEDPFFNINTPEDLPLARTRLRYHL